MFDPGSGEPPIPGMLGIGGFGVSLAVENVSHSFGGLAALTNVSFRIDDASVTSMIGPNGAGKTTMFHVMSGIFRPTRGTVRMDETDITGWAPHRIAELGIARTWQSIQLFENLTAIENVMVARASRRSAGYLDALLWLPRHRQDAKQTRELATELLEWVGMYDRRFHMPSELSYGYRRRLEIARALAGEPRVLMLDEPTSGVRAREAGELMKLVTRLTERGMTVFLIEHNMNVVKSFSKRVIVLDFGRIIADGTPKEVLADPGVARAYLGTDD